jgi:protein involved in polysaccharide export with SLBB domain
MKFFIRSRAGAAGALSAAFLIIGTAAGAQTVRAFETRAQLELAAQQATSEHKDADAYRIRQRLLHGDFSVGDRIVTRIEGPSPLSDTIMVIADKKLPLPQMGEVPLDGVLRAELQSKVQAHVSNYLRNSVVHVQPLVRVAVLGSVARPGFYYTSADIPISDVIMVAGGPLADADLSKVDLRRCQEVLVDEANTSRAITEGMSLDMLQVIAGDELRVGQKHTTSVMSVLPAVTALVGILVGLAALHR